MKTFKVIYHGRIEANSKKEAREILNGILYEAVEGEDLEDFEIVEEDDDSSQVGNLT